MTIGFIMFLWDDRQAAVVKEFIYKPKPLVLHFWKNERTFRLESLAPNGLHASPNITFNKSSLVAHWSGSKAWSEA